MNNLATSLIRTYLPVGWSLLIAWLIGLGLPSEVTTWLAGLGGKVTDMVVAVVLYGLARWVEPRLPAPLAIVFFGSTRPPSYPANLSAVDHTKE